MTNTGNNCNLETAFAEFAAYKKSNPFRMDEVAMLICPFIIAEIDKCGTLQKPVCQQARPATFILLFKKHIHLHQSTPSQCRGAFVSHLLPDIL